MYDYNDNISLMAFDIGDTLLSDDNTISNENINSIMKAKDMGINIALVTAREYSCTKFISHQIGADYAVYSNGNQKVKKLAKYITKNDNNNSGVSEGINYYLRRR